MLRSCSVKLRSCVRGCSFKELLIQGVVQSRSCLVIQAILRQISRKHFFSDPNSFSAASPYQQHFCMAGGLGS